MRGIQSCLLCFSTALFIPTVSAQPANPLAELAAGRNAAVEDGYEQLQKKFEQGSVNEHDLLDAYKPFYLTDAKYQRQLDAWIAAYPKSSSAYLARGIYFRKLGEFSRGTAYSSKVPPENMKYMQQMHQLAKKDLQTSLQLNPKAYLATLHLLNIAMHEDDKQAAATYLKQGNALLPSNLLVRARYLIHLSPRWGGSYSEMERFIAASRTQGLSKQDVDLLTAIMSADQGDTLRQQQQPAVAEQAYVKALTLGKAGGPRFREDYLRSAARICKDARHSSSDYCR
jgi:Domain of unknown function (DUF4034)